MQSILGGFFEQEKEKKKEEKKKKERETSQWTHEEAGFSASDARGTAREYREVFPQDKLVGNDTSSSEQKNS